MKLPQNNSIGVEYSIWSEEATCKEYPNWLRAGLKNIPLGYWEDMWMSVTSVFSYLKMFICFVLNRNTWNYITVCKQIIIE